MNLHSDTLIIIPSRLNSTRLPEKALKKIGNYTMVEHVWRQAKKTGLENIFVATDSNMIADNIELAGGSVIMTDSHCPTGTDRVYQAWRKIPDYKKYSYIINLQGDMPFVNPQTILDLIGALKSSDYDIITPVTKIGPELALMTSNVKVVANHKNQALYFSRHALPHGATEFLYHIGIYGFRAKGLKKFIKLERTLIEEIEKMEILRGLHHGMKVGICHIDHIPISVDTPEDLIFALNHLNSNA